MFIKAKKVVETGAYTEGTWYIDCYINSDYIDVLNIVPDEDNGCNVYTCFLTNDEDSEYEISEEELKKLRGEKNDRD